MNTNKVILDTNALLHHFLDDIPEQTKQVASLLHQARLHQLEILVPQIVIFELYYALDKYYHLDKSDIIDKLKTLVSTDYLRVEARHTLLSALKLHANTDQLSLPDCFLFSLSLNTNTPIFTFDQKLKKAIQKNARFL
ncbi:hypothetical protein A2368_04705 [Candidatus Collierbacteria bacterium RIFOXYB1_FULL_49_13]|uniref:PIN domain-containing protein n=1 Tax=Candidatus Collierbacteria bacterium RIFOXYB1_FULL_49_13 TaxID=1817728 RepID=A0A1F5FJV8_9BACT|nr:MAG: hypothetical protein A2368_04705 [Candidatus Collierbacteria bacterium RIFOXYB1_FULL_49_13]